MAERINWEMGVPTGNPLLNAARGYQVGRAMAKDRGVANALAQYPNDRAGAMNALAQYDPEQALQVAKLGAVQDGLSARAAARPDIAAGRFSDAAQKIAADDPELARVLMGMNDTHLDSTRKVAKAGASVLMSALSLPPDQRQAFVMQHPEDIQGMGITPEQVASYPWADDARIRADAARFLQLEDLFGTVNTREVGDNLATIRTNPFGSNVLASTPIPETRQERTAAERFQYQRQSDADTRDMERRRLDLAEREATRRGEGDVMATITRKIARGEPLTLGEQQLYQDSRTSRVDPMFSEDFGGRSPGGVSTIIPQQGASQSTGRPNAPRPGEVQQGYRFRGGDPADPRSWEKVR